MKQFSIGKTLVNVPVYTKNSENYTIKAVFRGFHSFDLPDDGVNNVSLKIEIQWILNGLVEKKDQTIYQLRNDIWFNSNGNIVESDSPEAIITECDYWLNAMVNEPVADKSLIESGIENLDLLMRYWSDLQP